MVAFRHDGSALTHGAPVLGDGDPFVNPGVWLIVVLLLLVTLATAVGVGLVYYGDDVARPSWNEQSVPAPLPVPAPPR